jgi:predicted DsbA family dithiol-disulfide isomerase
LQAEFDVALDWRGFELHPGIPLGGVPLEEMFGAERVRKMRPYLLDFARAQGVSGMVVPDHKPNTRKALALAEWARGEGRLHEVRTGLMDAYWRQGLDLEDDEVLARVAVAGGLDGPAALRGSREPGIRERVADMGRQAERAGVAGIPTFDIGGERVVGAQPYAVLAEAVARQGGRPRAPVSVPRRS